MTTYKFVSNFNDDEAIQEPNLYFYQVAAFADLQTNKYHIRRFTINHNNEFIDVKDRDISKRMFDKFLKYKKSNQYKLYPVYDLNYVDMPEISDILLLKSDLLSNHDYAGYATIN